MMLDAPVIERRSYPDRVLSDRHDYQQLLLGQGGMVELEVAGRCLRVSEGVLAPVPSGDLHHYLAPADNDVLVLDLPVEWCHALGIESLFESGRGASRRLSGIKVPTALATAAPTGPADVPRLAQWLLTLATALDAGGGKPLPSQRLSLLRLLPEVRRRLEQPWRVSDMASLCHLSEAVFARQFRVLMGMAPAAWLRRERLILARQLLMGTGAQGRAMPVSLSEIALACGFHDAAHFTRVFGEAHGMPPGRWRQQTAQQVLQRSESYKT
ncbi:MULTISPECIES: helix-turn-helix transcriptional regulator [Halomonas]|uniref:helix-turn-helix transcriptional regulator n=1 Tax=Halomonas TaxID=2745 RepID=UPI001CD62563|nr:MULTISPECIES: AraC family transcriptional regulator [Halomonas]MCA0916258.1 AraC family transcriptional regulator [Halomonas denitrificans]MED5294846.1 AraC family transcriptional regulator [Pseudomonadota bacterium]